MDGEAKAERSKRLGRQARTSGRKRFDQGRKPVVEVNYVRVRPTGLGPLPGAGGPHDSEGPSDGLARLLAAPWSAVGAPSAQW